MKKTIKILNKTGEFAENKDVAKELRLKKIMPALLDNKKVVLDFEGVVGATQSFVHALISDPIRELKDKAFDNLFYKNANDSVREIISIVYRYMQESLDGNDDDE